MLHLAGDGTVHVAWSDTRGRVLYVHHRAGEKAELQVICKGGFTPNGRHPSLVVIGRQVLIAFETFYDQIEYAVLEDGKWTTAQRLTSLDERLKTDVLHSPPIGFGSARRALAVFLRYYTLTTATSTLARTLVERRLDDCRGIYYRSPRFGVATCCRPTGWRWRNIRRPAPLKLVSRLPMGWRQSKTSFTPSRFLRRRLRAAASDAVLRSARCGTKSRTSNWFTKRSPKRSAANPLVKPGKAGSFDQDRVLNHGTVIYDDNRFRMWYGAAHRQRGVGWWKWMGTGYAQSPDGLVWEKPQLNVDPQLDANQYPAPHGLVRFSRMRKMKGASGGYKVVQFDRHQRQLTAALEGKYDMDALTCPGELCQSADGTHWKSEPISISFPDGKPWELVVQSFFIDAQEPDPARRWKIYGYATLVARRRAGCFAYSADVRHLDCVSSHIRFSIPG